MARGIVLLEGPRAGAVSYERGTPVMTHHTLWKPLSRCNFDHVKGSTPQTTRSSLGPSKKDFCIDNLLVRIHLIVEMISAVWSGAMGV